MSSKVHGVISAGAIATSVAIGMWSAWLWAPWATAAYAVAASGGFVVVLYTYCARCPCRSRCGHVAPGAIAAALFPGRTPGPYATWEVVAMLLGMAAMLLTPQAWLWRTPVLLAVFWVLSIGAVIEIRTCVCPACDNEFCPARVRTGS